MRRSQWAFWRLGKIASEWKQGASIFFFLKYDPANLCDILCIHLKNKLLNKNKVKVWEEAQWYWGSCHRPKSGAPALSSQPMPCMICLWKRLSRAHEWDIWSNFDISPTFHWESSETETEIAHVPYCSRNAHSSQPWVGPKLRTQNLIWFSQMGGRNPGIWAIICCLLGYTLTGNWNWSWNSSQTRWCRMPST